MKTSNKILLGFLLAGFGFIAAAQIGLHVKYVHKEYITPEQYITSFYDEYKLPNIKHVRLMGTAACKIIPSDITELKIEKSSIAYKKFDVSGDTLFIYGEYPSSHASSIKLNRMAQNVRLYVPGAVDVYAINSDIEVQGGQTVDKGASWHFTINNSVLNSREGSTLDSVNRYFDTLSVVAQNSQVLLFHSDHFKAVNVQFDHSLIDDRKAEIGQVNITTDSTSVIIVSGRNMNKLNSIIIKK